MKEITTSEFRTKLDNGEKVLVDFFATWCGPCRALMPMLESIQDNYAGLEFVKMDVDKNMDLAMELGIRSVPTVVLFEGTKEINRSTGANSAAFYNKVITESFNI
jgi:thioredoxin 1